MVNHTKITDQVCWDPPVHGRHIDFISRGFHPHIGADGQRSEIDIRPPLGDSILVFTRGYLVETFLQGILPQDSVGLEYEFSIY